jgi:hypothetical protein
MHKARHATNGTIAMLDGNFISDKDFKHNATTMASALRAHQIHVRLPWHRTTTRAQRKAQQASLAAIRVSNLSTLAGSQFNFNVKSRDTGFPVKPVLLWLGRWSTHPKSSMLAQVSFKRYFALRE